MKIGMYNLHARTITKLLKPYNNDRKEEFLECYQYQLEEQYGFGIDELADMAYGRRPDITKAC